METLDEAFDYLRRKLPSNKVVRRKWVLGDTILVFSGPNGSVGEIECYEQGLYLYEESGTWVVDDFGKLGRTTDPSLQGAADQVIDKSY